jgi:hypothetical protein
MSEPLALKALKLPALIFKILATFYIRISLIPTNILYSVSRPLFFTNAPEPKYIRSSQLVHRLLRSLFAILITIAFWIPSCFPIVVLRLWLNGIKNSPIAIFVFSKIFRVSEEGKLGKYLNLGSANISLGSRLFIYGVVLMIISFIVERKLKRYGKAKILGMPENYRLAFVFIFAVHAVLDLITLALYIPSLPFRHLLKNENYEARKPYLAHYLIKPNA